MDMQQVMNNIIQGFQDERKASSQFSLNDLIDRLEELPQDIALTIKAMKSEGY